MRVKLDHLTDVICLLPYFSHWINASKGETSDVVIRSVSIFVSDDANHTWKKMKHRDSLPF